MSQAATTIDEGGSAGGRLARARFASFVQRQGALIALVALCVFAAIRYERFLTEENLVNVLRQNSMLGLIALGMTFVILTGGIDLSVGSLMAVAGVAAATLAGRGVLVAVIGAVALSTLLGLINGVVIAKARIQPFIVTLAMMIASRGLVLAYTGEKSVGIGKTAEWLRWLGDKNVRPVPLAIIILIVAFLLGWLVLNHTRFGRHVYALGDNDEAARLMGLNTGRVTIAVYALSGALAGLAGVLDAAQGSVGRPVAGQGDELNAIAAVVVGGTLLTGGQGSVLATLVGVLLLGLIFNVFNFEGWISPWWQAVLRGLFLLVVVIVQNRLSKRK
ncbi:MAG TPA: ABC transporter permease [Pyrinomonadaceae bacterium]|jgi:ribose transport system permease protein